MGLVFDAGGTRCPLAADDAGQLAERLRRESSPRGVGSVVAAKIELILETKTAARELRLPNSERNAIAWTIVRWLEDVGAEAIPDGIMRLRYALDAETRIDIGYRSGIYRLPRHQATVLAESLRLKAADKRGAEAGAAARQVADAIEDVLVGVSDEPVRLDDDGAEAVFAVLNVSLEDPRSPLVVEAHSLYAAIRDARSAQA
jgi:hypothetical protein